MNDVFTVLRRGSLEFLLIGLLVVLVASLVMNHWPAYAQIAATLEQPMSRLRWIVGDISEAPFFGNELASLGLLLGVLLAYGLAPAGPVYGSHLVLEMVAGQAFASLIGVVLWRRQWMTRGWYPTYIPIVSIVPAAVLTLGGGWQVIVLSAGLGALIAPPLAVAISQRLPGYMHGYIGNVLSMAISTLGIVPLIGLIVGVA